MEPILTVSHLQKYYGGRGNVTRAIDDISLEVLPGEFVGIMGASGSGKTTLLNCVATIDSATAGKIVIDGREITRLNSKQFSRFRRERLGFIFQDCNLLDTLTAFENIALALTIRRTPVGEIEERVVETARLLEIEDCLNKYPYQMSAGSASARPPPGRSSRIRPSFWPMNPPERWTPSRPACCWTGLRPSTGNGRLRS